MDDILLTKTLIESFKDKGYAVHGRYNSEHGNEEVFRVELGSSKPYTLKQFLYGEEDNRRIENE